MWWLEEGAGFDAMQSLKNPGIATALGAAILFGASAPLAKLLLEGAAPQLLAGLFYLGSGVGLSVVWLRRRQSADVAREKPLTRHDLPWLAGAIVFGGANHDGDCECERTTAHGSTSASTARYRRTAMLRSASSMT